MTAGTSPETGSRSGQAMIESCLVVALTSLLFFGLFRIARLFAADEIVAHAAAAGARAEAVGFNRFMVHKVVRVASIPNAGVMDTALGSFARPGLGAVWRRETPGGLWERALRAAPLPPQYAFERSRIPLYLGAEHGGRLPSILEYEHWDTIRHASLIAPDRNTVRLLVRQDFPLRRASVVPVGGGRHEGGDRFYRTFYAADAVALEQEVRMDRHDALYLQ